MIPKGLFSQIALIILSVLVIFTYVKPNLLTTKTIQDKITLYQEQQQKVSSVNQKLTTLKSSVDSVSDTNRHRLLAYMPNTVDTIAVPRSITFLVAEAGAKLTEIKYVGAQKASVGEVVDPTLAEAPDAQVFSLSVEGSYEQIKQVLSLLEQNEYPLEVHELQITKKEGGILAAAMKIYTYNRTLPSTGTGSI
jgi:glucosamine 6-phosphate synthetase-like amidotransferase/phosphosugar isomerase protein